MNTTLQYPCTECQKPGQLACGSCLLVVYCGSECQKQHWKTHKRDCKSAILSGDWQPAWIREHRGPAFVGDGPPAVFFGSKKYLWGNVPALDILQLSKNEGAAHNKQLKLLFAASGDIRNALKTVASIPDEHHKSVHMVINDYEFDVVARNIILLLVAHTAEDQSFAAESMIHLWYSVLIRPSDRSHLNEKVRPLIEDVLRKIDGKAAGTLQAKTWVCDNSSVRVVLKKEEWSKLLTYFDVPADLTGEKAQKIRTSVTMAYERRDYVDRSLLVVSPELRASAMRFREDGLLLPFGHTKTDFTVPNPTFFQTNEWPMMDSADPREGWQFADVLATPSGPASKDLNGKLYYHIKATFIAYLQRSSQYGTHAQLFCVDARDLPSHLGNTKFARIETSNIADDYCLGIHSTLRALKPLLQTPQENPHATLLTLFMNPVQAMHHMDPNNPKTTSAEMKRVFQYLNPKDFASPAGMMTIMSAMTLVRDGPAYFAKYMREVGFGQIPAAIGMRMKVANSVVEEWPYRVKKKPGQAGAEREFRDLLASGVSGVERYVEWVRVD